jgi:DNA-binding NtrC family response regulator
MNLDALLLLPPRDGSSIRESLKPSELIFAQRILVADDDPIICRLISDVLANDGFAVNTASDGEQAWEALHHDHFDLLVTDNAMPLLTGIKLIERMRKAGMSLPAIIASGSFSAESLRDYPQLQIAAVIPKPLKKLEFLDTVKNVLSACEDAITEHASLNRSHTGLQTKPQLTELNLKLCRH